MSRNRRAVASLRLVVASVRAIGHGAPLVLAIIVFPLAGCTEPKAPPNTIAAAGSPATTLTARGPASGAKIRAGAQPQLASDPTQLADDLVADEDALRDRSTPQPALLAADLTAFAGNYRWDVYYFTAVSDVLLPIGYTATPPIPVGDYLTTHPQ